MLNLRRNDPWIAISIRGVNPRLIYRTGTVVILLEQTYSANPEISAEEKRVQS